MFSIDSIGFDDIPQYYEIKKSRKRKIKEIEERPSFKTPEFQPRTVIPFEKIEEIKKKK